MAINAPTPIEDKLGSTDSYISLGLGIAVVFIIGLLLYNFISGKTANNQQAKTNEQKQEEQQSQAKTHAVEKGETLWSIAQKYYNSGYNWVDIAKANNLKSDSPLEVGQTLTIPEVTPIILAQKTEGSILATATETPAVVTSPTPLETPAATQEAQKPVITTMPTTTPAVAASSTTASAKSYAVAKGDSLWKIAVATYGNGYRWSEIARLNSLANPNLIHVGNILQLP